MRREDESKQDDLHEPYNRVENRCILLCPHCRVLFATFFHGHPKCYDVPDEASKCDTDTDDMLDSRVSVEGHWDRHKVEDGREPVDKPEATRVCGQTVKHDIHCSCRSEDCAKSDVVELK